MKNIFQKQADKLEKQTYEYEEELREKGLTDDEICDLMTKRREEDAESMVCFGELVQDLFEDR